MIIAKKTVGDWSIQVHGGDPFGDFQAFGTLYNQGFFVHYTHWTPEQRAAVAAAIREGLERQGEIDRAAGPQWVDLNR